MNDRNFTRHSMTACLKTRYPAILLFVAMLLNTPSLFGDSHHPNIVLIMADDLGYGDTGCYGATAVKTPHIDQLASEGIQFLNGHCSASTCTPTRYSLLTGNYAFRKKRTGIAQPNAPAIIQPGTTTLPSILKEAGYATAVIGKWHLGLGDKSGPDWNADLKPGPLEIGFDTCLLLPTTNDRVPQVYVRDHRVENLDATDPLWVGNKKPTKAHPTGKTHRDHLKMDWSHGHNSTIHNGISRIGFYTGGQSARFRDEDLADRWVTESLKFMDANKNGPFFLFFASHDNHVPRMPHERFQGKSSLGFRGDAIVQLDWCVGELVKKIEQLGIAEETLIIFCSDNGPVLDDGYKDGALEKNGKHRSAGPYSGGKYSVYEGGTRTPFVTRWKGRIRPAKSKSLVCTIDFAASLAALTGQTMPDNACVDSFNVLGALLGEENAKGRNHLVTQNNGSNGTYSYRESEWKLLRHDKRNAYNLLVESKLANTKVPRFQLFNLNTDPGEKRNVADQHPELVTMLKGKLEQVIAAGKSRP